MIVEKLEEIVALLKEQSEDSERAQNGNASAGRRLRKASMEAIKQLKELRTAVLENSKK
ncbi:histone H1 [bacterium]|nr:histone H1 [bacterium]